MGQSHSQRCKYPEQNIREGNPTIHKKDNISWLKIGFILGIHINRLMKKPLKITSIDVEYYSW